MSTLPPSNSRIRIDPLRQAPPVIAPSLLLCDFANLEREVRAVEAAGARCLHLDVMDGVFVPNITYGMTIVGAVRKLTDLPLDVHMMTVEPGNYVEAMADAGADILTVHIESFKDETSAVKILQQIRAAGMAAGLALNPDTPLEEACDAIRQCDLILAMSVDPGFGAQQFDSRALEKLRRLREAVATDVLLEVDGGVNASTVANCGAAGAQMLVVGSAIFRNASATYAESISELTELSTSR